MGTNSAPRTSPTSVLLLVGGGPDGRAIRQLLEHAGYRVREAADSPDPLGSGTGQRPNLVVTIDPAKAGLPEPSGAQRPATIDEGTPDATRLTVLNDELRKKIQALEAHRSEHRSLVSQLLSAHDEERERIANGLHDDALQALAAVKMGLSSLCRRLDAPGEQPAVAAMVDAIGDAINRLRGVLAGLRSPELGRRSLHVALGDCLERLQRENGITTSLVDDMITEPDVPDSTLLYRTTQEIVMNARGHARASHVSVALGETPALLTVTVVDDGDGFSVPEAMRVRPGHVGLPSMRARLEARGGALEIQSGPGHGAKLVLSIPRTIPDIEVENVGGGPVNESDPASHR